MAETWWGNILEFLFGVLVLPRILTFAWLFIAPTLHLSAASAIASYLGISAILIVVCFFLRKSVALGLLIATLWDAVTLYGILHSQ